METPLVALSRGQLAHLCREFMLAAQFNSRCGYAALRINHGDEAYKDVAIDNWMAASPVYTRRMQRAMSFVGDSVETIFKGLQLECGMPHQYMDARFALDTPYQGRFWLDSCGPLLETEPRGEDAVRVMCHDIEDPTFDATAVATNPRARMRPVHRPPRVPAERAPHCEWRVFVDDEAEPLVEREITREMAATGLAQVALPRTEDREPGGLADYSGELFEQMQLERFSHAALVQVCGELGVQVHLLSTALMSAVALRYGDEAALAVGEFQMEGSCWVLSNRLADWLGCAGGGLDAIEHVLALHPAFHPRQYFDIQVNREEGALLLALADCPAVSEASPYGWQALLRQRRLAGLQALVRGVDTRAGVEPLPGRLAWRVTLDASPATEEPFSVQVAKSTVLYQARIEDHIQLLQL